LLFFGLEPAVSMAVLATKLLMLLKLIKGIAALPCDW